MVSPFAFLAIGWSRPGKWCSFSRPFLCLNWRLGHSLPKLSDSRPSRRLPQAERGRSAPWCRPAGAKALDEGLADAARVATQGHASGNVSEQGTPPSLRPPPSWVLSTDETRV